VIRPERRLSALLTDLYQLTMLAGYVEEGIAGTPATFDLYFRKNPYQGGFAVFAGLEPALRYLEDLRFTEADVGYLATLGLFRPRFLDFLRGFRFTGRVTAPPEGSVWFANAPLLTVEGPLAEVQLVETALLNLVNFQTLVATKAARVVLAARGGQVLEFGLRRAHGPDGAMSVARAAAVGGVRSTSNVLAGATWGLPVRGTHAHSWVMAHPDELTAFRKYAEVFPDHTVLLVDTFDTLLSGVPNAITVARELRATGHELQGIRLDSGDLAFLSREARRMLDDAGFPDVRIVASSDLDEHVITAIQTEGGRVDVWGVGTQLATCGGPGGGALGGVYKLVRIGDRPVLKVTSNAAKATLPDHKRVWRAVGADGRFVQDVLTLADETPKEGDRVYAPTNPLDFVDLPGGLRFEDARAVVMDGGRRLRDPEPLDAMADRSADQLARLPEGVTRLLNPHLYKVSISPRLQALRARLTEEARKR
jgi:nicotinate phosphoribosyltransferase